MSEILRPYIPETWAKYGTPARVKTGTLSGLRISAVDGTAFVDNAAAVVDYADGNHMLDVIDSSGRLLRGILSAAGTSEGLGSELVTNGDMELDSDWLNYDTPQINERSTEQVKTGTYSRKYQSRADSWSGGIRQAVSVASASLYRLDFAHYSVQSSYKIGYALTGSLIGAAVVYIDSTTSFASATGYITALPIATTLYFAAFDKNKTYYVDDVSLKQVTAPSSDGALIVSARGGSTRNFASKDASFAYNESSYAYRVWRVS